MPPAGPHARAAAGTGAGIGVGVGVGVGVGGAVAIVAGALLALTAWQYAMPATVESPWGLNHLGVEHFRGALGLPALDVGAGAFRWGFRALLLAAWGGYLLLVLAALRGARLRPPLVTAAVLGLAVALAVLWPASLSTDVYGYAGYARLEILHGRNPYLATQRALVELGDPTAPFVRWEIRSPYGPAWTLACATLIWALHGATLWAQIVALKLLAASGVVLAAWAGRELAERLEPGRGDLAFAAIGLNPLFLVEAAGSGHNDLVMMALVLAGLAALAGGRATSGAWSIGVAAALKFVPLLLVPWIAAYELRARPSGPAASSARARAWARAALVALVGVLPLVIAFAPFWHGESTLDGLRVRWAHGRAPGAGAAAAPGVGLEVVLAVLYLAASLVLLRRFTVERVVTGWIVLSTAVLALATGIWFPWYLAWPWAALLTRWDRRHARASLLIGGCAVAFMLRYAAALGGR